MKRVYTCLVGDLFHSGHVNFLRQAKAEGDHLIVGVCSDEDCAYYKRRTIMTMEERAAVIEACRYVDEIILAPPSVVPQEFLDLHRIDLLVHADDVTENQLRHFYGPAMVQGKYKSLPYTKGVSTTEIIKRVVDRKPEELERKYFMKDA